MSKRKSIPKEQVSHLKVFANSNEDGFNKNNEMSMQPIRRKPGQEIYHDQVHTKRPEGRCPFGSLLDTSIGL